MRAVTIALVLTIPSVAANSVDAQQKESSVDELKFLKFLIGEWDTPDGTATWKWVLNGRILSFESYDDDGNHKMSGKTKWDPSQKIIVNRFYTSGGNFYSQTWTRRNRREDAVIVCFPNGKYYFTMRAGDDGSIVVEYPSGNSDTWTRKKEDDEEAGKESVSDE